MPDDAKAQLRVEGDLPILPVHVVTPDEERSTFARTSWRRHVSAWDDPDFQAELDAPDDKPGNDEAGA